VTGLNGRPFGSWKKPDEPEMWLRDWLGPDLASGDTPVRARIFTYGYPSKVADSFDNSSLYDLGQGLLAHLAATRRSSSKPLILIGHSLGGLVIKQVGAPLLSMLFAC
jgi:protein SERAC1